MKKKYEKDIILLFRFVNDLNNGLYSSACLSFSLLKMKKGRIQMSLLLYSLSLVFFFIEEKNTKVNKTREEESEYGNRKKRNRFPNIFTFHILDVSLS